MPTELSAASIIVQYWNKGRQHCRVDNNWVGSRHHYYMMGAGAYGEAEFIFA